MSIFPTWYASKATPIENTDVVFSSNWVDNFNLSVWEIWTKAFSSKTTDNLTEWTTNLYLNETNLADSTLIQGIEDDVLLKADKTNVLEKDNTTAFTPTADYHPATKAYVDSRWTNIVDLSAETSVSTDDSFIFYDISATSNKKITQENLTTNILNWLVQNGTLSSINASIWTWSGIVYSTAVLITKPTIWVLSWNMSGSDSGSILSLQTSPDNVTYTDLYINTFSTAWSINVTAIIKWWLYYRTKLVKTASWGWSGSITLTYTY